MLRGMVFVDHMNFDIAIRNYYNSKSIPLISLDYNTLFKGIVSKIPNIDYLKTFIFAPKPDDFKGTDINLAIHALSKAYNNAYDVAFVISADTDYISLYKQLKNLGKIVIVVTVSGQSIGQIIPEVDDYISLDDSFFSQHIREPKNKTTEPYNDESILECLEEATVI